MTTDKQSIPSILHSLQIFSFKMGFSFSFCLNMPFAASSNRRKPRDRAGRTWISASATRKRQPSTFSSLLGESLSVKGLIPTPARHLYVPAGPVTFARRSSMTIISIAQLIEMKVVPNLTRCSLLIFGLFDGNLCKRMSRYDFRLFLTGYYSYRRQFSSRRTFSQIGEKHQFFAFLWSKNIFIKKIGFLLNFSRFNFSSVLLIEARKISET